MKLEPSLVRCCHNPCGARLIDYPVNISNKLLLDIRKYIKKYYIVSSVSVCVCVCFCVCVFVCVCVCVCVCVLLELLINATQVVLFI